MPQILSPEEEECEEYVVEKILKDKIIWLGYDNDSDNTWEVESNLNCDEILKEYLEKKGESIEKKELPNRNKRSATETRKKEEPEHKFEELLLDCDYPPSDMEEWDPEVDRIETIENRKSGSPYVYIIWKNGLHTRHYIEECNHKCTQSMLDFYESRLNIDNE